MPNRWKRFCVCLAICALALWADRFSKAWARDVLSVAPGGVLQALPGFLRFSYVRNTGMAFSALSGRTGLLSVLNVVLLVGLAAYGFGAKRMGKALFCGISLLLAGGLGNLWDRLTQGFVTDFLEFTFVRFAVFNVADVCVCAGVGICLLALLFGGKEKPC